MVEQLVQMLHRTNLGLEEPLSAVEIADIIWLAAHLRNKQPVADQSKTNLDQKPKTDPKDSKQDQEKSTSNKDSNDNSQGKQTDSELSVEEEKVSVISDGNSAATSKGAAIPFSVPAATAISQRRAIARALRLLNSKVPSKTKKVLDPVQTLKQSAEEEFCVPILKPALQRWLDVVLVVETSPAYGIWQKTIKEFRLLRWFRR